MSSIFLDKKNQKKVDIKEKIVEKLLLISALVAVFAIVAIIIFILVKGIQPFIGEDRYSFIDFLTGLAWVPSQDIYGIGYMIIGSLLATIGAVLIGVPIALFTSIFIVELAPKRLADFLMPIIELLAGIPSVLYGIFGLGVLVPFIAKISINPYGESLLAVILVLAIMILPTVIAISVTSLRSIPVTYKESSLALGATHIQTIFKVILPAAKSGIFAGVILGIGRAIGETMAIILVAGNPEGGLPGSIWDTIRPMTASIALEMSYAAGDHLNMLFATGAVLLIFILVLNIVLNKIKKSGDV